ncbi:MAG TPA: phosphoribosylformylglycinamidine synthase subunit PurS [Bacteroidetes bacterium]|nr:phosphoribosylformylglycinamidine synthase subunit PurS [Bacteroidota bacterium]
MIVIVQVMPKEGILDPQGEAVRRALLQLGHDEVRNVKVGKRIRLELDTDDRDFALRRAGEMARTLLANPNVETFRLHIEDEDAR